MTGIGYEGLLAAILRRTPRLPAALCREMPELFNCANGAQTGLARAISICQSCPELGPCQAWASTQRHLTGVVAGEYHALKRYDEPMENRTGTSDDNA